MILNLVIWSSGYLVIFWSNLEIWLFQSSRHRFHFAPESGGWMIRSLGLSLDILASGRQVMATTMSAEERRFMSARIEPFDHLVVWIGS